MKVKKGREKRTEVACANLANLGFWAPSGERKGLRFELRQSQCLPSSPLSYYLPRLYHIPPQPLFTHSSSLTHASIFATTPGEPLALVPPPPPPKYAHRLWDPTTMLSLSLHHPSQAKGFRSTPILACHYALLLFLLLIIHHAAAGDIG
ncbi:uncharacterized protein HKW66_Vig0029260 [Vigna angularis]|uniref:Uncharacterized protein n=1 Tax=Phaseolus angularis TaxID=3914 RepID=A0A8T0L828_PHAAN|nr:uncharacterized protein HKW66_Vig0029260 [Vigna angularis]